jgi:hypothetical protein
MDKIKCTTAGLNLTLDGLVESRADICSPSEPWLNENFNTTQGFHYARIISLSRVLDVLILSAFFRGAYNFYDRQ